MESVQYSIHNNIFPQFVPSLYTQRFEDKLVLIIEVSKGTNKPYFKKSEGLINGTYIRFGLLQQKLLKK